MNLNQYSLSAAQPGLSVEKIKRLKLPFVELKRTNPNSQLFGRQNHSNRQKSRTVKTQNKTL